MDSSFASSSHMSEPDAFAMMMGAKSPTAPTTKKRAARKRKPTKAPKAPDGKLTNFFFPMMKMGAKSPTAPTVDMTLDTR